MSGKDHQELSRLNREHYEREYGTDKLTSINRIDPFFSQLTRIRLDLLYRVARGKTLLDVGCGIGGYLLEVQAIIQRGVGLDFSSRSIGEARSCVGRAGNQRISFVQGDAMNMPFAKASFDAVFSESALSAVSCPQKALNEIGRVLRSGGAAVIGLGNSWSLNNIVCQFQPETVKTFHVPFYRMPGMLRESGLTVEEVRSFQILPYWGDNPWWLRLLLKRRWRRIMSQELGPRMIDEWISSLPFVRHLAFRHLWLCRKRAGS